jgi:hypothetical protein
MAASAIHRSIMPSPSSIRLFSQIVDGAPTNRRTTGYRVAKGSIGLARSRRAKNLSSVRLAIPASAGRGRFRHSDVGVSTSTPLNEYFTGRSFGKPYPWLGSAHEGSEQRPARLRKYRLAIEPIAACYCSPVRAACSIARSYRNRSHSVFTFRGALHHSGTGAHSRHLSSRRSNPCSRA